MSVITPQLAPPPAKRRRSIPRGVRNRIRRAYSAINLFITKRFYHLPVVELECTGSNQGEPLPILEDVCLPPYVGPPENQDFSVLMHVARVLQPKTVVELGTAHGNIAANICRQCPDATVYTVNALPDELTGEIVTYALTRDEIGRVYKNYGFEQRVVQILENTLHLDLSKHFDAPVVDLAIIDACHDTDYVINDFLKVQPFVKPDGVVLFHDTHPSMAAHLEGSYVACMTLKRRGYDIRHVKNTWWAVWVNSDEFAPRLQNQNQ